MKTLKQFMEEAATGYRKVKSPDEQKFVDKHVVDTKADRAGNKDDVFKATNVKKADRKKENHGYEPGEDESVYEELKGGQKKLDKNHNGKLDAHDFKLLRKKKVAEEAEQIDEILDTRDAKMSYAQKNMNSHKKAMSTFIKSNDPEEKASAHKTAMRRVRGLNTFAKNKVTSEEAEQIDELKKGDWVVHSGGKVGQVYNVSGDKASVDVKWNKTGRVTSHEPKSLQKMKEEAGQIDELSKDKMLKYLSANKKQAAGGMGDKEATKRMRGADLAVRKYTARDNKYVRVPATEEVEIEEKHLTPAEMKKREEIAKAMEREHPGMDKSKKMAIATATAKKVAEETLSAKAGRAGKDLGKPGKNFEKIANAAAKKYGSVEAGKKVAGAVLAKMRANEEFEAAIAGLSERHQVLMSDVYSRLNEDNQQKFAEACQTEEGLEAMVAFAIENRGE